MMDVNTASGSLVVSPSPLDKIQYAARSHIGRRRENQDRIRLPAPLENPRKQGILFAVADGMGGHHGGGVAGRMVCAGLAVAEYDKRFIGEHGELNPPLLRRSLEETVLRIDRRIRLAGRKDSALEEMGTTLSCLVLTGQHGIIAHVGDSRIYRLRGGHLTRLTSDHTFVQDMIFEGKVASENARKHPLRHLLTRVVGTKEPLEQVDTRIESRHPQDRYLLCMDGLYQAVDDERLKAELSSGAYARQSAESLVQEALGNGARDNITALVIFPSAHV